jgi:solute carrier family 20 (sodium-dependent phosphate transporter)
VLWYLVTTSTIAGGIADIKKFSADPEMYAYGMVISLGVAGFLQILGSYLELNISSTHSIIGCIMGFSLVYRGRNGVNWAIPDTKSFPPYKGVVPIFCSWVFSPLLTAVASATIFLLCRTFVLRRQNASKKALYVLPIAVFGTTWINVYFVLTKGAKKLIAEKDSWSDRKASLIALFVAISLTVLATFTAIPYIIFRANKKFDSQEIQLEALPSNKVIENDVESVNEDAIEVTSDCSPQFTDFKHSIVTAIKEHFEPDLKSKVEEDELVSAMHRSAEVFEERAEYIFSFLQVFSAISVVFAHGAGEVGYMAGPLTAIWDYAQNGVVKKSVEPPIWIILISASGLVVGLAAYGQKLTVAMAVKLTKLSPTRGFAAELATATVIMVAAQYGLPTSSSQCIIGGLVGVGLLEGMKGVNWKFFAAQAVSWVVNLFLSMGIVAAIFAQGVFSPSIYDSRDLNFYESNINYISKDFLRTCNTTLTQQFNTSINPYTNPFKSISSSLTLLGKQPNPHSNYVIEMLNNTLTYYKNSTC